MEAPGYRDNPEKAQQGMIVLKGLKEEVETYDSLKTGYESIIEYELDGDYIILKIDGYDFQQLFSIDENCSCKEVGNIRIEKNKRYKFNQFFQAEHIIPVYVIKDELDKLVNDKSSKKKEKILIEDMRKVLEKIHICRITRDEAKILPLKREVNDSSKKLDYSEYYETFYKTKGIILVDKK